MFYLTIFIPLSVSGKLTGTLSVFITRVKPAPFGLLCAWREVPILCQHVRVKDKYQKKMRNTSTVCFTGGQRFEVYFYEDDVKNSKTPKRDI
jgi:hypothetical protein